MRILISYEESYHLYSNTLHRALAGLRPEAEVAACRLSVLGEQVKSFNPHIVVSSRKNSVDPGGRAAWYRLSPEPDEPSEACLGGRRWQRLNPTLEELLSFIDEVEAVVRGGRKVGGCKCAAVATLIHRRRGREILRTSQGRLIHTIYRCVEIGVCVVWKRIPNQRRERDQ
jgi:predicted Zn-dependent protease